MGSGRPSWVTACRARWESSGTQHLSRTLGEVAEWQTRMVQVHVPERAWGFNSPLPHQITTPRCHRAGASLRVTLQAGEGSLVGCPSSSGRSPMASTGEIVSVAVVTGSGRPDRLRGGSPVRRPRTGRGRRRQRPAPLVLRRRRLHRVEPAAARQRARRRLHPLRPRRPRPRRARRGLREATARDIAVVDPLRRAAQPRLGGQGAVHRLRRQRGRHAQRAGERPAHASPAPFIHCSTNKVYGDRPNALPLVELETRYESAGHPYSTASPRTCRSTPACTRSSGSPRWRPTSWSRSTAATSA